MVTPNPALCLRGVRVGGVIIPLSGVGPWRWHRHCHTNAGNAPFFLIQPETVKVEVSITYSVPDEVKAAGFQIGTDELGSVVESRNSKKLKAHDGVEGIMKKISASTTN
ncbi:hypothetical protein Tco_0308840 [Tanacetum coccineum]